MNPQVITHLDSLGFDRWKANPADIVFCRFSSSGWEGKVIQWKTGSPIAHVELECQRTGWTLGARLAGGVALRGPSYCDGQRDVLRATFEGINHAWNWILLHRIGWGYDRLAILGFAGNQDWHCKKRRFCSEVVAEAAEHIGNTLFNDLAIINRIDPEMVRISKPLRFVSGTAATVHSPGELCQG